jgi:hypothetical protein
MSPIGRASLPDPRQSGDHLVRHGVVSSTCSPVFNYGCHEAATLLSADTANEHEGRGAALLADVLEQAFKAH